MHDGNTEGDCSRNTFSSSSDGEVINACRWTPEICYGDILHTPCHSYVTSSRCRHFVITELENFKLWNWGSSKLRNVCFKFHEIWTSLSEVSIEGTQTAIVQNTISGCIIEQDTCTL